MPPASLFRLWASMFWQFPVGVDRYALKKSPMKGVPNGPEPAATDPAADRSTMSREIWASPQLPKVPVCPEVVHQALPPATIVPSSVTDCRQQPAGTAIIPWAAVHRKEPNVAPG